MTKNEDGSYTFRPIGIIHTPFETAEGIPIQGALCPETQGWVEIFPEFAAGLQDVEGFSHLILLYIFHRSEGFSLITRPFLEETPRGLFAIRAPKRPNPIGLTVVRLLSRDGARLEIGGVDMLDGTPLLDIKPYVATIDAHIDAQEGWISGKMRRDAGKKLSNGRFSERY
jgi:tRNA-Thr(GGU) m(6)t(6)A37 methyltransferase TsaA